MIRISTRSHSRGRHVLLADVYDFAFLGRLRLAGRERNVASADDGKNNDKQTEFHVSSPKTTQAIQFPRARSLQNCSEREAHRENPAVVVPVELRRGDL